MSSQFWTGRPVIPVVVIHDSAHAVNLARTLVAAGFPKIEITLRTEAALKSIELIAQEVPGAIVGAGTVVSKATADSALSAGAQFLVSPGATPSLLEHVAKSGIPFLPGAATLSEALSLLETGITTAKFFPAMESGGVAWLKAISTVIPQMSFCPTGGITPDNFVDFLALPNVVCVGGSWVAPAKLIQSEDWEEISRLSKAVFPL